MLNTRVIPCLLLKKSGLVKTVKFKNPKYLGDPINIIRIFNDKEVDEIVLLDITATLENRRPDFRRLSEIVNECFMPIGYGGGIKDLDDIRKIFATGVEKVIINTNAVEDSSFIEKASGLFGSQSIVVSIDAKKNPFGEYRIFTHSGTRETKIHPIQHALHMQEMGAGEILLNSIDRDGTMLGYDLRLVKSVSDALSIPVIACGGAGNIMDFKNAVKDGGASAIAAGSIFVFYGDEQAVLINFPSRNELNSVFSQ